MPIDFSPIESPRTVKPQRAEVFGSEHEKAPRDFGRFSGSERGEQSPFLLASPSQPRSVVPFRLPSSNQWIF